MREEYKYLFHNLIQWSQEDNDKYVQTVDRLYIFLHAYMDDCDIQYLKNKHVCSSSIYGFWFPF